MVGLLRTIVCGRSQGNVQTCVFIVLVRRPCDVLSAIQTVRSTKHPILPLDKKEKVIAPCKPGPVTGELR